MEGASVARILVPFNTDGLAATADEGGTRKDG